MVTLSMGLFTWYKRFPHAAISGMTSMSLEEVGAYNLLLDWMWVKDGKLPDDPKIIARYLHTNSRRWKRLRDRLISMHKIYVLDGHLRNDRLDREFRHANGKAQRRSNRAATKGRHK